MTCGTHLATFPARALKFPDRAAKFPVPGEKIPCSAASGILLQAIGFPRRLVARIAEKGPKLKNSLLNSLFCRALAAGTSVKVQRPERARAFFTVDDQTRDQ